MSAITFAEQNAGRRFAIPRRLLPDKIVDEDYDGLHYYGQVVGHFGPGDDRIAVELEESAYRDYCWPKHSGVTMTVHGDNLYDDSNPRFWAVDYKLLPKPPTRDEVLARAAKFKIGSPEVEAKPIAAYPSVCTSCNQPARKSGNMIVCSNKGCATRQALKKKLDIKHVKAKIIRCPRTKAIFTSGLLGKPCNKRAVYVRTKSQYSDDSFYTFKCEDGHTFEMHASNLKENDVVLFTLAGNDNKDRIWNGKKWEIY